MILRKVEARHYAGSGTWVEKLECGHEVLKNYQADVKRRRCKDCESANG